jgi:hypothetical protein
MSEENHSLIFIVLYLIFNSCICILNPFYSFARSAGLFFNSGLFQMRIRTGFYVSGQIGFFS